MNVSVEFTDVVANRHASTLMDPIVVCAGKVTRPLGVLVLVSIISALQSLSQDQLKCALSTISV